MLKRDFHFWVWECHQPNAMEVNGVCYTSAWLDNTTQNMSFMILVNWLFGVITLVRGDNDDNQVVHIPT